MIRVVTPEQAWAEAAALEKWSLSTGWPAGIDTEFFGCNPDEESVVGRAQLWSLQIAYGPPPARTPSDPVQLFIPADCLEWFKPWLACSDYPKVGSDILTTERHVLANTGAELHGVVGCTRMMGKLLNPSNLVRHGLKPLGESLGYTVIPYKEIAGRPKSNGKVQAYKKDRIVEKDGIPTVYTAGAEYQTVSFGSRELLELPELWSTYPQRRGLIVAYAVQDAAMSLDGYWHLKRRLEVLKW